MGVSADEPLAFEPDDEAAWQQLARGYRLAGLLLSAHRLGLLRRLADGGQATTDTLARDLIADETILEQMCRALHNAGLLRAGDAGWRVSDAGRRLLGDPAATVELDSLAEDYQHWGRLDHRARALAAGETPPLGLNDKDVTRIGSDVGAARRYAVRLSAMHRSQARNLVAHVRPTRPVRVIDIGGADGLVSREICRQWPDASSVVLEQPAMAEVAERACASVDRISVVAGDFLGTTGNGADPLPGEADVVVLSHVLAGLPTVAQRTLCTRAVQSLAAGGCVLTCESVLRSDKRGPLDVVLWAVGEAARAHEGHLLTTVEQDLLLRAAGLAASSAWWVSDNSRAVLGVRTDAGVRPALEVPSGGDGLRRPEGTAAGTP